MITHNITQTASMVKVIVNWQYNEKKHEVVNSFNAMPVAVGYLRKVESKILVDTVRKYINHRQFIFRQGFTAMYALSAAESLAKLEYLKTLIEGQTLEGICRSILFYKDNLIAVLPSSRSKYYKHDSQVVRGIINDCKYLLSPEGRAAFMEGELSNV
jgi:hypothetical protein